MATPMQMPGLLGGLDQEEIQNQAMKMAALQAGLTGLMASGPSLMPVSTGQVIGQAGAAGLGAYQQGLQQATQQQAQKQLQQALSGGGTGQGLDRAATAANYRRVAAQMAGINPQQAKLYLDMADKLDVPKEKLSGEMANLAYTMFKTANVNDLSEDQLRRLDEAALQRKLAVSRAGASNVSVSTEKTLGTVGAEQLIKTLAEDRAKIASGIGQADMADRIQKLVNEGVYVGPGGTTQTVVARLASQLGVAGKDMQDTLNRTSQVVQQMAGMTLKAAESLKGSASDKDIKFLERVASANISDLTAPEISRAMGLISAVNRKQAQSYNTQIDDLVSTAGDPKIRSVLNLYKIKPRITVEEIKE